MTEPTKEAYDLAARIFAAPKWSNGAPDISSAAALIDAYAAQRVAEAEAHTIELCAQVAHNAGRYSERYLDGDIPQDVVTHNRICWSMRDGIRALKEPSR